MTATSFCPTCYSSAEESNILQLPCTCTSCSDCLATWIQTQAKELHYLTNDHIPCMNSECKEPFKVDDVFEKLDRIQQEDINSILLDVYLKKTQDIRKCPNSGCTNAGVIDLSKPCSAPLECSLCTAKWRESAHIGTAEKIRDFLLNGESRAEEALSYVWEVAFTRICPKCKVLIQKNGGCSHMTCAQCKHEFCWVCNQNFHGHGSEFCQAAIIVKLSMLAMFLVNIFWMVGVIDLALHLTSLLIDFCIGGIVINILGLAIYVLYSLVKMREKYDREDFRRQEADIACAIMTSILAVLVALTIQFDMVGYAKRAAFVQGFILLVFSEWSGKIFSYIASIKNMFRSRKEFVQVHFGTYTVQYERPSL